MNERPVVVSIHIAPTGKAAMKPVREARAARNHLVGWEFEIGEVVLRGTRLCEPCAHLEKLTVKGALRGLIHRGGLRAKIVSGGTIRVGDAIHAGSSQHY